MARAAGATLAAALLATAVGAQTGELKLEGYAEWRHADLLIVDGQRLRAATGHRFKGGGDARDFASIPLGYEVKAKGERLADGVVLARELEAKPNGDALFAIGVAQETIDDDTKRVIVQSLAAIGAMAWQNGYGRSHEDQADRVGLRYAHEAGYAVARGPGLWNRFAQKYGDQNKVANFFFSDHSVAMARAANLERELRVNYSAARASAPAAPALSASGGRVASGSPVCARAAARARGAPGSPSSSAPPPAR